VIREAPRSPPEEAPTVDAHAPPAPNSHASPATGPAEIGRFLVLRLLGAGGMGVVYVAYDPQLDRKVAVKLLHPGVSGSAREQLARARLAREAKALARLSHPNVVAIYDVGEQGDQIFIAMEYIEGAPLSAWLRERPQGPAGDHRELIAHFLAAGRGLAAAHRQGLVHGDFKPDNVLVGADGRARVVDFGLASAQTDDPPERAALSASDPLDLSTHITASGALAGTPAYLAPEQFRGAHGSALADQYSFCVSLYEGLYGQRPFHGADIKQLHQAVERGLPPEPRERAIPAWLRKILVRGLSADPTDRFPDMDALLVALSDDPRRRRRRRLITLLSLLTLLAAALLYRAALVHSLEQRQGLCSGATDELRGVWDPDRRERARLAFLATERPYAVDTWERVAARLDAHSAAWSRQFLEICRATHLRGEQSPALLDLRLACMRRRLAETRSLTDVLLEADATVVENAVQAAAELPDLEQCLGDAEALAEHTARRALPADAVASIQDQLDRARALEHTARFQAGLLLAEAALLAAERLPDRDFIAHAQLIRGTMLDSLGDPDAAPALTEAFYAAAATEDTQLQARAALTLLHHSNTRLDLTRAEQWSRHARALLDRLALSLPLPARASLEFELASQLGTYHLHSGRLDDAERDYRRALALTQATDLKSASLHNNLGNLLVRRGDFERAAADLGRAVEVYREQLGLYHPLVAAALNNLGELEARRGDWEAARAHYNQARAIFVAALGAEHPNVGVLDNNLGHLAFQSGEHAAAAAHFERALAVFTDAFGPDAAPLAYPLTGIGELRLAQGDPTGAAEALERALLLGEAGDPTDLARTRFALARALAAAEAPRARELALAALTALTAAGPAYARQRAEAEAWLAETPLPP
jgi:Tfp pilus assembly protein PilF/predicted Ser/Thr protein kinase